MASRFGVGHAILPPPVEQPATPPALNRDNDSAAARLAGLTIGYVGRNWRGEPPTEEAELLRRIGAAAGSLALYDAGVLRYALGGEPSIRFHPRQDLGFERFLDSLDCLLLTPDPWWREEGGRDLFSAMASGVPALLPAASIYAEYIDDGVDGLLYRSPEEAVQRLADLRRTPRCIAEFRRAARAKIARLLDPAALADVVRHVVAGGSMDSDSDCSEPSRLRAMAS
jgi:glycosyltransferase involved in cell wall biosynthesis